LHNLLRTNAVRSRRGTRRAEQRRGAVAVEAAFCLPLLVLLMIGMWEVGRMVQVSQILANAAREGARYAAMGNLNVAGVNTPITVALVQQNVRDYLNAAGLPAAAYNGAQVQLTNLSGNTWTNPSDAQPMDKFQVTVTIPSGTAFSSLQWTSLSITGTSQLSASATWVSLVDSQVSVNTQLPF
jgi:Flp pilus assembly protein TadG